MCEDYKADEFFLFRLSEPSENAIGRWTPREPLGKTIRISLVGDVDQSVWHTATSQQASLDKSEKYEFSSSEYNRDAIAGRVNFTLKDIEDLTPQQVFLDGQSADDPKKPDVVSLAEFESYTCNG